jgi:hypothetical protein
VTDGTQAAGAEGAATDVPQPDPGSPATYSDDKDQAADIGQDLAGGSGRLLAKLLTSTPFMDLHDRVTAKGSLTLFKFICAALELMVRIVVVSLLIGIAACVAWKTLAPLPHIFSPSTGSSTTSTTRPYSTTISVLSPKPDDRGARSGLQ